MKMANKLYFISCRFWYLAKCYFFVSLRLLSNFKAATVMPEDRLVISMVTPDLIIEQMVGK